MSTGNAGLVNFDVSRTDSPYATGRLNGVDQTITTGTGGDFAEINFIPRIGGTNNGSTTYGWKHCRGEVAEIMLFSASLGSEDIARIESYLALKIWNRPWQAITSIQQAQPFGMQLLMLAYQNDLYGIGKDDIVGLNQEFGESANTSGQGGNTSSLTNPDALEDRRFSHDWPRQ